MIFVRVAAQNDVWLSGAVDVGQIEDGPCGGGWHIHIGFLVTQFSQNGGLLIGTDREDDLADGIVRSDGSAVEAFGDGPVGVF